MSTNNGGPAFPVFADGRAATSDQSVVNEGMSLRDWFAGKVVEEMIRLSIDRDGGWDPVAVATGSYAVADAMLAERDKS